MIEFESLAECDPDEMIAILNSDDVRKHLMPHSRFTRESLAEWVKQKELCNTRTGCRVRAVLINKKLAGWCGIQDDERGYELAIVLARPFWGCGKQIFEVMQVWAGEFGHRELIVHLHHSRQQNRFLTARSGKKPIVSTISGHKFYSYTMPI